LDQAYLSKCRVKIKKAIKDDSRVEVTERKVQLWFNIINLVIFKNELPKFTEIEIFDSDRYHAICECDDANEKYKLLIFHTFKNKKKFVEVIVHEMIHLHDFIIYGEMAHGKRFFQWRDKLKKYGLELYIKY
jgi:hypothetical protein